MKRASTHTSIGTPSAVAAASLLSRYSGVANGTTSTRTRCAGHSRAKSGRTSVDPTRTGSGCRSTRTPAERSARATRRASLPSGAAGTVDANAIAPSRSRASTALRSPSVTRARSDHDGAAMSAGTNRAIMRPYFAVSWKIASGPVRVRRVVSPSASKRTRRPSRFAARATVEASPTIVASTSIERATSACASARL